MIAIFPTDNEFKIKQIINCEQLPTIDFWRAGNRGEFCRSRRCRMRSIGVMQRGSITSSSSSSACSWLANDSSLKDKQILKLTH